MINRIPFLLLLFLASADVFGLEKEKTVLVSDHFYGENDTTVEFQISHAKKERSIVLILKEKTLGRYDIASNPINVTLICQDQTTSCEFSSYYDLCVVPQVQDPVINFIISCQSTPCDVSWIVYQLEFGSILGNQLAQGLFVTE